MKPTNDNKETPGFWQIFALEIFGYQLGIAELLRSWELPPRSSSTILRLLSTSRLCLSGAEYVRFFFNHCCRFTKAAVRTYEHSQSNVIQLFFRYFFFTATPCAFCFSPVLAVRRLSDAYKQIDTPRDTRVYARPRVHVPWSRF